MRSYLELVTASARVHRKQNRMCIFCIVLAVFLITVIFGMADMFIRSQLIEARERYGNWHVILKNVSREEAALICARPQVKSSSWYGVLNYSGQEDYTLTVPGKDASRKAVICGAEESFLREIMTDEIAEGVFPRTEREVLVTENATALSGLKIGDEIGIRTPEGEVHPYVISGFMKNVSKIMMEDTYGVFLSSEGFHTLSPGPENERDSVRDDVLYLQFSGERRIRETIDGIRAEFGLSEEQMGENTALLGLLGQSGEAFMLHIYGAAAILFLLVMLAGILMITSSLNSNVAAKTEFYGMLRCIGATPKQVMRLVRREALSWCRTAIPLGVAAGVAVIWILCGVLRLLGPAYFGKMPVFGLSVPSIAAGVVAGIGTVLLAARTPARRASRVSPLAAVSGNRDNQQPVRSAACARGFRVDTALGIHHAWASRKNFLLMTGSFALSMILFLSFSVTVDFMRHALTPMQPWTEDLAIVSPDSTCSIEESLVSALKENPAVKRVYGRKTAYGTPAVIAGVERTVDLISYEEYQFGWAEEYLLEGSVEETRERAGTALAVSGYPDSPGKGDRILVLGDQGMTEIQITGVLSKCPLDGTADGGIVICSEETFDSLLGETKEGYTVVDIQLAKKASEEDVGEIRRMAGTQAVFSDSRINNSNVRGTFYSFGLFIYGFLVVIALIALFNIVNSIAMSVSARKTQYGIFRAVGLTSRQLRRMVAAEAVTYALSGSVFGCILGLGLNRLLFEKLVTSRWGEPWQAPFGELGIILLIVAGSVVLAVRGPVKRIRETAVVDVIGVK